MQDANRRAQQAKYGQGGHTGRGRRTERQGWHEEGKHSNRTIPGILARGGRHVCKMQAEKHNNMQARKDTSREEHASKKKATWGQHARKTNTST